MSHPEVSASREALRVGSRSFSFASKFLPTDLRDDAAMVYAFCRAVDDAADLAASPGEARDALGRIRDQVLGKASAFGAVDAFLHVADRRAMPLSAALALLDGVESDLEEVRILNDEELVRYGYFVAGTVGLLMCGVLGVKEEAAFPFAIDLGIGMQLTNIARDVLEDAERGRVYLPANRLRGWGVEPEALPAGSAPRDRVRRVVLDVLSLAEPYYRSGLSGLRYIPPRPRMAIQVAATVYRQIGFKLGRRGGDALAGRTVVSLARKIGVVLFSSPRFVLQNTHLARRRFPDHRAILHAPLIGLPGVEARR